MPFHFNYIILRIGTGTYVPKAKRVLHNKAELYIARCRLHNAHAQTRYLDIVSDVSEESAIKQNLFFFCNKQTEKSSCCSL